MRYLAKCKAYRPSTSQTWAFDVEFDSDVEQIEKVIPNVLNETVGYETFKDPNSSFEMFTVSGEVWLKCDRLTEKRQSDTCDTIIVMYAMKVTKIGNDPE